MSPIPDIRPLTEEERRLLEWLMAHRSRKAADYLDQLAKVSVVSRCGCGCPTIFLTVDGRCGRGGSTILADFSGVSPEGVLVGVLVHVREELLSELEVYSMADDEGEGGFSLPRVEDLQ